MKNSKLKICDTYIQPGESANLALPLPEQNACAPLFMPIRVIHGKEKGPCLVIFSLLKGNELNGLEITNRVTQKATEMPLKGTIIAIPVMNVYGLTHYPRSLPSGGRLDRCFPGSEEGSFGERIAHVFTEEILKKADYVIELQTGDLNHNILPQVYCNFDDRPTKELAKAFQSPVVTNVTLEGNNLRQTTEDLQIPLIVYEAGEAMRFDENAINLGVNGVFNVMRAINILPKEPTSEINPIFSQDEEWILAHNGGILHPLVSLGQTIQKNDVIATISDPFGSEQNVTLRAPQQGVVVGINTTPLIHEGLPIFKIASFLDNDRAESTIEAWDKKQPDSYIN
tara:strand:- start:4512 stop:5531 length:1020 start_codon:yes stop_codon:yes gene_type:complete